jgi:hypothetical protein
VAITRVQYAKTTASAKPIAPSWTSPTAAGNYLAALLAHGGNPGAYTPPANWSQVGSTLNNGTQLYCSLWQVVNAASQSGSQSWTWANTPANHCIFMIEYSGIAQVSPQDGSNQTNTGTSTSPATGTLATTSANDLLLGLICQANNGDGVSISFSAPTSSFSLVDQEAVGNVNVARVALAFLERIVSATGSYSVGVTSNDNNFWAGILAGFSAVPTATPRQWRRQPRLAPHEPRDLILW